MNDENTENAKVIASEVAAYICCDDCLHPNFFEYLDDEIIKRGYKLCLEQKGIFGTSVYLMKE